MDYEQQLTIKCEGRWNAVRLGHWNEERGTHVTDIGLVKHQHLITWICLC